MTELDEPVANAPEGMFFIKCPYGVFYGIIEALVPPANFSFGPFRVQGKSFYAFERKNYTVFRELMAANWWNRDGQHMVSEERYINLRASEIADEIEWWYRRAFQDNRRKVLTEARLTYDAADFEISVSVSPEELAETMAVYSLRVSSSDPYLLEYIQPDNLIPYDDLDQLNDLF